MWGKEWVGCILWASGTAIAAIAQPWHFQSPWGLDSWDCPARVFAGFSMATRTAPATPTTTTKQMIASNSKMLQIVRRTSMEVPNNEMSNVPNGVNTVKNERLETLNVANSRKNGRANKKTPNEKSTDTFTLSGHFGPWGVLPSH